MANGQAPVLASTACSLLALGLLWSAWRCLRKAEESFATAAKVRGETVAERRELLRAHRALLDLQAVVQEHT